VLHSFYGGPLGWLSKTESLTPGPRAAAIQPPTTPVTLDAVDEALLAEQRPVLGHAHERSGVAGAQPIRHALLVAGFLRTADVSPADGFEAWQDMISSTFVPVECRPISRDPFRGEVLASTLGDIQLTLVRAGGQLVVRDRRMIAKGDADCYKVGLQTRGDWRISQDGRVATLAPGDLAVWDCGRPYTLTFAGSYQGIILMLPRGQLRIPADAMGRVTATRISGRDAVGSLVSPFLVQLAKNVAAAETPDTVVNQRLACNTLDLLITLFSDRLGQPPEDLDPIRRSVLVSVRRWIELHLDSPALDPETIARANHMSVRYLHQLFHDQGTTVSRWVKERRLERCLSDLDDPALANRGISGIAARWGFTDAAYFSRAFKDAYGRSPREYRSRAAQAG
jgi:AraC-like DNA-binding protein